MKEQSEKEKLEYLLRTKKWNPYCLRHSAHGGKIWAENNSDGKGTTFTFSVPLSLEAVQSTVCHI